MTCKGVKSMPKKTKAMLEIKELKTVKELQSFLGLVIYYCNIWKRYLPVLAPLSKLKKLSCKKKLPWRQE